ncbi:MAG: (d)CMP kinase [Spirochaetes bacterium]|nr:MAG: (d)CMP kinase [Spirochaetota bacterium]
MIVAIDGPAGVGKSTVAREIARKMGMFYLNSGNFYRAITWGVLNAGIDPEDRNKIIDYAQNCTLSVEKNRVHLNGIDIEEYLHSDAVDEWVAEVSSIREIREIVNSNLKEIGKTTEVVAEGRDVTTVVFPDADVKVYLDASLEKRAERRFKQGTSFLSVDELISRIKKRDALDKNKPFGKLKIADDALYLDTSDLTIDEVCEKVITRIKETRKNC